MVEILVAQHPSPPAVAPSQPQQIIVIPQSLLQQGGGPGNRKPLMRVAPTTTTTVAAVQPAVTTMAASTPKISLKRPLPPLRPEAVKPLASSSSDEDEQSTAPPVRKRANLDHLSPEEKLMRRKLKNRVAAQNARDKKRAKIDEMEALIQQLQDENQMLKELNQKLSQENNQLRGENPRVKDEMPPSPPLSLPRSPAPPAPVMSPLRSSSPPIATVVAGALPAQRQDQAVVVSQESEPAELVPVLQPKERSWEMAADPPQGQAAAAAATLTAVACLAWTCLQAASPSQEAQGEPPRQGEVEEECASSPWPTTATSSSPRLPLKKRGSMWWGPRQRSWTPPRSSTQS